jgi:Tfp pilus assembly protein PilX
MAGSFVAENIIKMTRCLKVNDEGGFILIATLVSLLLLVILGISTTTTTNIELQIAGNDKVNMANSYVAEGTAYEAAQLLENGTAVTDGTLQSASGNGSNYSIVDNGIAGGSSLGMTSSQVHIYAITGLATNNNSNSSIGIGFKKRF